MKTLIKFITISLLITNLNSLYSEEDIFDPNTLRITNAVTANYSGSDNSTCKWPWNLPVRWSYTNDIMLNQACVDKCKSRGLEAECRYGPNKDICYQREAGCRGDAGSGICTQSCYCQCKKI